MRQYLRDKEASVLESRLVSKHASMGLIGRLNGELIREMVREGGVVGGVVGMSDSLFFCPKRTPQK